MVLDSRPAGPPPSSRSTICLRASNRSRPAYSPASAVILPSGPITTTRAARAAAAMAKSFASCAGVTLTMPVPNSRSTRIGSSTIGSSRPMIGRIALAPAQRRGLADPRGGSPAPCRPASSRDGSWPRPRPRRHPARRSGSCRGFPRPLGGRPRGPTRPSRSAGTSSRRSGRGRSDRLAVEPDEGVADGARRGPGRA